MNRNIIILLVMAIVVAAIGQYTSDAVRDNLRLSRRRQDASFFVARVNFGKFGINKDLIVG